MEQINVEDCFFDASDRAIYFINKIINNEDISSEFLMVKPTNIYIAHILTGPRHLLKLKRIDANIYLKICKLLSMNANMCRTIALNSKPLTSGPISYYIGRLPYIHIHKLAKPTFRLDISNNGLSTYEGAIIPPIDKYMDEETYNKILRLCFETFNNINNIVKEL